MSNEAAEIVEAVDTLLQNLPVDKQLQLSEVKIDWKEVSGILKPVVSVTFFEKFFTASLWD